MTAQTALEGREAELKRDIVIGLANAYYETYRYERPNDSTEQLSAFYRDLASNDVDEMLAAHDQALIQRVREAPEMQYETVINAKGLGMDIALEQIAPAARNELRDAVTAVLDELESGE